MHCSWELSKITWDNPNESWKIHAQKPIVTSIRVPWLAVVISADMFVSVNKKTIIHPLYKAGLSIVKGLPEEARLYSDGWSCWYTRVGYRKPYVRRGAASVYYREFQVPIAGNEGSPFRSHTPSGKLLIIISRHAMPFEPCRGIANSCICSTLLKSSKRCDIQVCAPRAVAIITQQNTKRINPTPPDF